MYNVYNYCCCTDYGIYCPSRYRSKLHIRLMQNPDPAHKNRKSGEQSSGLSLLKNSYLAGYQVPT